MAHKRDSLPVHKPEQIETRTANPNTNMQAEDYYTLKNFPPVRYYSLNGGGSGHVSPYRVSDARHQAYTLDTFSA